MLIALLVVTLSFTALSIQGLREALMAAEESFNRQREMLDVALRLKVEGLNSTSCNITVANMGSKTIFLRDEGGFSWNTIIVSYGNSSFWVSYAVEDYLVLEVKVSGADRTFPPDTHSFIDAGEEALICFSIPPGAPEIPINGLVSVAFVTHYGVVARAEAVRQQ